MKARKNKKLWPGLNFKDKQRGERGASSRRVTCREVAFLSGSHRIVPTRFLAKKSKVITNLPDNKSHPNYHIYRNDDSQLIGQ